MPIASSVPVRLLAIATMSLFGGVGCDVLLGLDVDGLHPIEQDVFAPDASDGASTPDVEDSGAPPLSELGDAGDGPRPAPAPAPVAGNGDPRWAQSPMPSDLPEPASYAIANGPDGAILTDGVTGLSWQDTLTETARTFDEAVAYCDDLVYGGFDDWRLPTRIEGLGLMRFDGTEVAALESAVFSSGGSCRWTSSEHATSTYAWTLRPRSIGTNSKAELCTPRCVRGGAPLGPPLAKVFDVTADTVIDRVTGLVWERTAPSTPSTVEAAAARCAALSLGKRTMRLPTVKELASIVDEVDAQRALPAAFGTWNGDGMRWGFWTSSGWMVRFDRGSAYAPLAGDPVFSRCVATL